MVNCLFYRICVFLMSLVLFSSSAVASPPAWVANLLPHQEMEQSKKEETACLALAIYFESRGEPEKGQRAVGNVILNRTRSQKYPDTVCAVLFQKGQFSFIRNGRAVTPKTPTMWENALRIANELLDGNAADNSGGALSFCQRHLRKNGLTIGNHIFF